jgi:hypothetical protein
VIFRFAQDNVRSLGQITSRKVWFVAEFLGVTAINEYRPAPGGVTAIHVPPAIAHHPALHQVNVQCAGRALQHAGLRFATIAIGRALARMITNFHAVDGQPTAHFGMYGFDDFFLERAAPNIWLVGHDDQQEAGGFEFGTRRWNLGKNLKFGQASWRIGLGFTLQGTVDNPVTVEKNSTRARRVLNFRWLGHVRAND